MIADEVLLLLKGTNLASTPIGEVSLSLKGFRTELGLTTVAMREFNVQAGLMPTLIRGMIGPQNDLRFVMSTTTQAIVDQSIALRTLATSAGAASATSVAGAGGGVARTVAQDASFASRVRLGGQSMGPLSMVTGGLSVPTIAAVVAGYLGYRAVRDSSQFNQSIADIVANSTQDAGSIPGLQSGVLGLAGGANRFTPQQLTTALYPIASSPIFKNQQDQVAALKIISQMAQASGAGSLKGLSASVVGAVSAYNFAPSQTGFVADTIAKGVNIGLAEAPDFAKGVGTFSAASLVADPNARRAFQMSIGAFAQQTNLSPRFRFDAQGENAFFQQVTGRQSKTALGVEQSLGIQDMFGVGGVGRYGGLAGWLQHLQSATGAAGADNQQLFLQNIFGRQNALQFVRGFTGSNFQGGQLSIAGALNADGTVNKGAAISDTGPQARFDQAASTMSKDMILVGDTISKTLSPALAQLAIGALGAAQKLGDVAGGVGNGIDWLVAHTPGRLQTTVDMQHQAQLSQQQQAIRTNVANMTPAQRAAIIQFGGQSGYADAPGYVAPHAGPAAPFIGPTFADITGPASDFTNQNPGVMGNRGYLAMRQQQAVAAASQRALALAEARRLQVQAGGVNTAQLVQDRGSINYDISTGASNSILAQAVAKLHTDLGASGMDATGQRNYLQKFGTNPLNKEQDARAIDAATIQYNAATVFEKSVQIHHGSLAASTAAANQVYQASLNLIAAQVHAGTLKKTDAATLQLNAQDVLQQTTTANLAFPMQEAQARLSLAQLTGKGLAGARGDVAALLKQQDANAPDQLALALYQLYHTGTAASTALPAQITQQLIRPMTGLGGLQQASFGQTIANLTATGGGNAASSEVGQLRAQIAYLQQTNRTLNQQLTVLKSIDGHVSQTSKATTHTAKHVATSATHTRGIGPIHR